MTVKLLTERHLELLSLKGAAETRLSLHLSECHIVGNHMPRANIMLAPADPRFPPSWVQLNNIFAGLDWLEIKSPY